MHVCDGFKAFACAVSGFKAFAVPCDGFNESFAVCDGFEQMLLSVMAKARNKVCCLWITMRLFIQVPVIPRTLNSIVVCDWLYRLLLSMMALTGTIFISL